MTKIGIVAIQGGFHEHANKLLEIDQNISISFIRNHTDCREDFDGIIIPGGESTVIRKISMKHGVWSYLSNWVKQGKPIWGTCAGIILLASKILSNNNLEEGELLQGLSINVSRNAYGRQIDSFQAVIGSTYLPTSMGIFIRAPVITHIYSSNVQVLGYLEDDQKGNQIVAIREGSILGTTFHPELTDNIVWHQYFIDMINNN